MLWTQAFHVIFMVSWFAGIFYLPRILVYYAAADHPETKATLAIMARKLYRFVTPFMLLTIGFGVWRLSAQADYYLSSGWMHAKLACVAVLVAYHIQCGIYVRRVMAGEDNKTHVFYRFFNEVPVLFLFAIVLLVYIRPF
ncbi:membrane protein [Luminiphilus syltensis NOR5-1B]|uniref:Protoporphyrinogen IX oxidase n=1 Tax=Luminiphilus syltensis NOR5-1B TaxID=565045 RepID=B8KW17_9GAMM|nr:CopD family protein [Luminiphilus syltensis]EED34249.1 membrane protein [Luminiphilus syltensis NOR5-1B]